MRVNLPNLILIAAVAAGVQPINAYDFTENGVYYNILQDKKSVEVTYNMSSGNSYSGEVSIPQTVTHDGKTYTVTAIGDMAFSNSFSLSKLSVPSSIATVGNKAFYSCAYLDGYAFIEGLTTIGDEAFYACNTLGAINIPASVTSIGKNAFAYCQSVKAISVAAANPDYASDGVALYNKSITNLICCPAGLLEDYTFPATVTSYEAGAFIGASMLPGFKVESGSKTFKAVDGVLYNADTTKALLAPMGLSTAVNLPEGCIEIAEGAFKSCLKMPSVTFPSTLTAISDNAFASCASLTEITIPGNVKNIGAEAFSACYKLESAILKEGIQSIGDNAFYYDMALLSINLPSTLKSIGKYVFGYCPLKEVYNAALEPQTLQADTFTDYSGTLHVRSSALDVYKNAEYWKNFADVKGDLSFSGVESITVNGAEIVGYYDLSGRRHDNPVKGLNIVEMSDGSYQKVIIK